MKTPDWSDPVVKIIAALATATVTIVGALVAAGVIGIHSGDPPVENAPAPVAAVPEATVVDNADQNAKPDDIVDLGPRAREVTETFLEGDDHDLAVDDGAELRGDDEAGPVAELQPPFASDSIRGCRTRFLTTNWSYRTVAQSEVKWFTPHFTAGVDIPNSRADVDGLTAFGNTPSARVSWHFNLDKDGNCDYNVPLRYKAWTFSDANSRSINAEVAGRGEQPYLRPAGYRKLARIYIQVRQAYPQIRLRVGSISSSNCASGAAGWVTHWMGGTCAGNHSDIRPHSLTVVVAKVRKWVRRLTCAECRAVEQRLRDRERRHSATHAAYQRKGCRGRLHKVKPADLGSEACRELKLQGKRQHAGIAKTRVTLRELRAS